eukprot:TRINITY_DN4853_c0_g2_i1.p3 TRINITY_DN4853_c0_g2~~TRINITY_DN4853_c0_g2_i1.p3  ORF type:complete len:123 (-),score=36.36 TRINITY_DN4853_c0_g2_i1:157-525(-)
MFHQETAMLRAQVEQLQKYVHSGDPSALTAIMSPTAGYISSPDHDSLKLSDDSRHHSPPKPAQHHGAGRTYDFGEDAADYQPSEKDVTGMDDDFESDDQDQKLANDEPMDEEVYTDEDDTEF